MMTSARQATARAHSNIAFIKYWGNTDDALRLPANPSMSMNLDGIYTETTVQWDDSLNRDTLVINGREATGPSLDRVSSHLDFIRRRADITSYAAVDSANNFPMGAGIASSASSFAALTVAATRALALDITERELTTIARLGSGSASRSVPTGFVEWYAGERHEDSYAQSIASPEHWDLVDVIAIVSGEHKAVGSTRGHHSANTSDLQPARVAGARERLARCRNAVLERNFAAFAEVVEHDSNLMHAVMMTSQPPLFYWLPATLTVMDQVRRWRADGLKVCYTLDAGPNIHCICDREHAEQVSNGLRELSGIVDVRSAKPGHGAYIVKP